MTDAEVVRALCWWFARAKRDLPWRTPGAGSRRDPYRTLVSEIMLQQTQVSRVSEKFGPFVERFPSVTALADASEDDVLAAWTGLGYYRRARSLHAAAKAVRDRHDGVVPCDAESLRALPGVGRYTAGAVASIAFDRPAPIVDGNVTRVVLRLEGRALAGDDRDAVALSWARAENLVGAAARSRAAEVSPGNLNESLMELGATVCTPRGPACFVCPVRRACGAFERARVDEIPLAKARAKRRALYAATLVWTDGNRVAVRKRGSEGLWAGLWELPTLERDDRHATAAEVAGVFGCSDVAERGSFSFATTHRDVRFRVFESSCLIGDDGDAQSEGGRDRGGRGGIEWVDRRTLEGLGMSSPHRRVLAGWLDGSAADDDGTAAVRSAHGGTTRARGGPGDP